MTDEKKTPTRRSAYLPVLPDGCTYSVTITGSGGLRVEVSETVSGAWAVQTLAGRNEPMVQQHADTLDSAMKVAATGARALVAVKAAEAEVAQRRAAAVAALGEPVPTTHS